MFKLTSKSLNTIKLKKLMSSPSAGAFCSFEGRVRNHHKGKKVVELQYEAHSKLCEKEAKKILSEAKKKYGAIEACIFHRVGRLKIGEEAVWIGVISSHRDEAFKVCRYLIDEIKARLPIWKKEIYLNGDSGWINSQH